MAGSSLRTTRPLSPLSIYELFKVRRTARSRLGRVRDERRRLQIRPLCARSGADLAGDHLEPE